MGRVILLCRNHFYKVLILVILSLMALQYGLSAAFYGGKPYLYIVSPSFNLEKTSNNRSGLGGVTLSSVTRVGSANNLMPNTNNSLTVLQKAVNTTNSAVSIVASTPDNNNNNNNNQSQPNIASGASSTNISSALGHITNSSSPGPSNKTELPDCPAVPPKLVGPVKVWVEAPSFEELEKIHPELELGGRFRPPDCKSKHKVAIIIPYRDRELHLRLFLHNLHPILQRQQLDYGIFVVEEVGDTKFNRAMLMNIGYVEALKLYDWHCFIFHDVDLLPEDDRNIYSCPEQPRHMSVAVDNMGYKLPYADIFGGVSALTKEQMEKVNGFSNEFWGWGGEDDDMANRIKYYGYKISRYSDKVARYKMMKHSKDKPNPDRYNKLYKGKTRYKTDGINSLKYKLRDRLLKRLYTWVYVEMEQPK